MTKTYNEIISTLREIARDYLRMVMINQVRTDLLQATNSVDALKKDIQGNAKQVAVCEYKLTKLEDADPEFEDKTKLLNDRKNDLVDYQKDMDEQLVSLNKNVDALNKKIDEITKGEIKVNMDALEEETQKLAKEVIKAAAVEAVNATK